MTITVHLPDPQSEQMQSLRGGFVQNFLHGECYAFAIALHQGLGWPLVGLIDGAQSHTRTNRTILHAGVRSPGTHIYDADGPSMDPAFAKRYVRSSYKIIEIDEEELRETRPVSHSTIHTARKVAELWWPDLPWKDSLTSRLEGFVSELEGLSKKYGFWIGSNIPTQRPQILTGYGDEAGYDIHFSEDGMSQTIDRRL